jgi:phosphoenolpyruvate carboxylase
MLKNKMQFLMKTLTDQDSAKVLQAYNGLKRRKLMIEGVGMSDQKAMKTQLIKRLTNKPFDLQCQAFSKFIDFLKWARQCEKEEKEQYERDQKEKERIIRRIMNKGLRDTGMAFRQARIHTNDEAEKERILMFKQRGIMRKMSDVTTRLMGMGFNK